METKEFNEKKKYSEASGSMAVMDSNLKMQMNQYGFYEEMVIDNNTGVSQKALNVSPNFNNRINETMIADELYGDIDGVNFDKRIGYYSSLHIGHVTEGNYRDNASSGGMGTWIFKELFDKDLIDYVIHVKKAPTEDEVLFKYEVSSSIEEISAGAKTRYYPVEISEVIERLQKVPGRYAIVGIPSFIYSVRLLANENPVIKDRIKYTVGLICGHQKSSKFAEAMAWQAGIKPGNLIDIDFRHKLLDRKASHYGVKMKGLINGVEEVIIKSKSELFGQNWGWGLFKPVASDFTDDVFNETADIVLGDAWLSEYTDDSNGNNIVIVRTPELSQLVSEAVSEQRLKMDETNKEKIFESQASHYVHTHDELSYRLYKKDTANEWRPKKRVEADKEQIVKVRKKVQDLRTELATNSHIAYEEAVKQDNFNHFTDSLSQIVRQYDDVYKVIKRNYLMKKAWKLGPIGLFKKVLNKLQ